MGKKAPTKRLNVQKIRNLCTEESYSRGVEYLNEGRVRELGVSGSIANAMVRGTRNYRVEIDLDHDFSSTCTCPYDFEGYCKHIVATLLALSKDYEGIVKSSETEKDEINSVLESMDAGQLRDFLKRESRDKTVKRNLLIFATGETKAGGRSVDEYKKDISELYDTSGDGYIEYGNEIEFSEFVDLADRCLKKKNFPEAARVYHALSEVIAENMDSVDDSDGYYGERFWEAIRGLSSCVNSMRRDEKLGYISYLFQKFTKMEPDYFQEGYDEALRLVCTGRDDLLQLKKLLAPRLPRSLPDSKRDWSGYYESSVILDMQAFTLDGLANLGDGESRKELYELLQRYYLHDEEFCLLFSERLEKDGRVDEAIKVAEEGLRTFPAGVTTELKLFLNKHYETRSPERYRENLKILFFEELDWSYYEKLRKLSGDQWSSVLQEILKHFSSNPKRDYDDGDGTILIEIYVREKMFDSALKEILARRSLRVLSRYYKRLSERYPGDYFNAYRELLIPYADAGMGRDRYHEVALQLKKMKAIKGFERDSREFVDILRQRYAKRPAFLDEIKGL